MQKNLNDSIIYNEQNAVTLRVYNKDLEKRIKQELAKNSIAQKIIENIIENTDFEI